MKTKNKFLKEINSLKSIFSIFLPHYIKWRFRTPESPCRTSSPLYIAWCSLSQKIKVNKYNILDALALIN